MCTLRKEGPVRESAPRSSRDLRCACVSMEVFSEVLRVFQKRFTREQVPDLLRAHRIPEQETPSFSEKV
jgi:hypothetical protein